MGQSKSKDQTLQFLIVALVCAVIFGSLGYWFGKGSQDKSAASPTGGTSQFGAGGPGGQGGFRRMGGIGAVTVVSDTSITIDNTRTGSTNTYTIDSSTSVTNNGAVASISDIKVGDNVLVSTVSSTSTAATRIVINPSFGGGGQNPGTNNLPGA
jgi:hypothetical protein